MNVWNGGRHGHHLFFCFFFDMYNHSGAGVAAQAVVALPLVEPVSRPPGFQLMWPETVFWKSNPPSLGACRLVRLLWKVPSPKSFLCKKTEIWQKRYCWTLQIFCLFVGVTFHTKLYWFQMSFEEDVSSFWYFCLLIGEKVGKEGAMTSPLPIEITFTNDFTYSREIFTIEQGEAKLLIINFKPPFRPVPKQLCGLENLGSTCSMETFKFFIRAH